MAAYISLTFRHEPIQCKFVDDNNFCCCIFLVTLTNNIKRICMTKSNFSKPVTLEPVMSSTCFSKILPTHLAFSLSFSFFFDMLFPFKLEFLNIWPYSNAMLE